MVRIKGYTILSQKEMEDLIMTMIDSESTMEFIRDKMKCGYLEGKEIKIADRSFRVPLDSFIDILEEEMQKCKKTRENLRCY